MISSCSGWFADLCHLTNLSYELNIVQVRVNICSSIIHTRISEAHSMEKQQCLHNPG